METLQVRLRLAAGESSVGTEHEASIPPAELARSVLEAGERRRAVLLVAHHCFPAAFGFQIPVEAEGHARLGQLAAVLELLVGVLLPASDRECSLSLRRHAVSRWLVAALMCDSHINIPAQPRGPAAQPHGPAAQARL